MCSYRGDWIEGVLYREQQDLVATVGIVRVGGSGDPLAGGVIEVGLLASNVHCFTGPTGYTAVSTLPCLKLHQSLALEWHHHHVAGG